MSALALVSALRSVGPLRSVRRYWLHPLTHSPTHPLTHSPIHPLTSLPHHTETLILMPI
ncbi:MAG: hypothetical protein AAF808_23480 [Cyanobacteria bacterium P01_D01_bin.2]